MLIVVNGLNPGVSVVRIVPAFQGQSGRTLESWYSNLHCSIVVDQVAVSGHVLLLVAFALQEVVVVVGHNKSECKNHPPGPKKVAFAER